jgi:hypothetical protein
MTTRERLDVEKQLIAILGGLCTLLIALCVYVFLRVQSQIDQLNVGFIENRSRIVGVETNYANVNLTLGRIDKKLDDLIQREMK